MTRCKAAFAALFAFASTAETVAQFTIDAPTTDWVVVQYPPGTTTDYFSDQQTGSGEADIVGGGLLPSFYTRFIPGGSPTTGTIYFRVRLGADDTPSGFKGACFLGVDANADGKLDVFFGVNNSGSNNGIYIWPPGNDANTSPSTTSIGSPLYSGGITAANYHWAPVTATIDPAANTPALLNTDGRTGTGQTDYFLSFSLPFATVVSTLQSAGINGVTDATPMRYVMGTATQANAFNQDLNGVNGGVNSPLTWEQLGAITTPITPYGEPANVPPVNAVPGPQSAARNATIAIPGLASTDADGNLATVSLAVTRGALQVSLAGGATITGGANGTATLTLSGTQAQIDAALATVTFTAPADYSGPVTFTVVATDAAGATDTDAVAITVLPNQAPVAENDAVTTGEDTAATFDVLANDSDPDGGVLSITAASVTSGGGTVAINANNTLTFTPAADFNGVALLNYSISDGQGGVDSGTVTVTITAANDAPVAMNDAVTIAEDSPISIAVLENDNDVDGDALAVIAATLSSGQGSISFDGGTTVVFTPAPNFFGPATITYTISDGNGGEATAQITISVTPVNDDPVAENDTATTSEDVAVTIAVLGNDMDPDGDALSVTSALLAGGSGTVAVNPDNTVDFTPAADFHGTASVSYAISDGKGGTASATITITVLAVNDPPVAVNDSAATARATAKTFGVLSNDYDVDGDLLRVVSASVDPSIGTVAVNPDFTLTFTPVGTFVGSAAISYSITDDAGGNASAIATVQVLEGNQPPTAVPDSAETDEDSAVVIAVLDNDSDDDEDLLTVVGATVPPAQGAVAVNGDGTLTYTPAPNFKGTASITYTISDGFSTASAAVTVTVNPVNDAPVASDDVAATNEDAPRTVAVLGNDTDVDGDALVVTEAVVTSGFGSVVINPNQTLTFSPAANFHGTATILYAISDGNGGVASATLTITVVPVNDAPVAVNDTGATNEDSSVTIAVLANDSDADDDPLTVTSVAVTGGQGVAVINGGTTVTFTPALNFHGTVNIVYTIADGQGGADSAVISVTVAAVNDDPVANDDTTFTSEETAVTILVLANDTDADGDSLAVSSASVPAAQGTVLVNPDGSLLFTPASDFNGAATISYTIGDGNGGTASAVATVHVTAVNDDPIAQDDSIATPEDTPVVIHVLANDSDGDGDSLNVASATVPPAQGNVAINPDGTLAFTPARNFHGVAVIGYTIEDGQGGTASAVAVVTVTPVNDLPVATNDTASVPQGRAVMVDVLANDTDADGTPLAVTGAVVQSGQGVVVTGPDGTIEFTPAPAFIGNAVIIYTVADPDGGTASAFVTITVDGIPVAINDTAATPLNTAVNIRVLDNDADPEGLPLSTTGATVSPLLGTAGIQADGSVLFTPATGVTGQISIPYAIRDAGGNTASATIVVSVGTGALSPPSAVADRATTELAAPVIVPVLANDADPSGGTLTVTGASFSPAAGAAAINPDGTVTFTAAPGFTGITTVTYTIASSNGGTASAPITITVSAGNTPPLARDDSATAEAGSPKVLFVLNNDADPDGDALTITSAAVGPAEGVVAINADGTLTFTSEPSFFGSATITYAIEDGRGGTGTAVVTVTVSAELINQPPVANNDAASGGAGVTQEIAVLGNDSDPDGDALTVVAATLTSGSGTVTINPGGTLQFAPAAGFNSVATILYTVADSAGATASAVVTVNVNDNPVAVADRENTQGGVPVIVDVLANDSDPNGNPLSVTGAEADPAQGVLTLNPDGTITFTPAAGFGGEALFHYTISDGKGATAEGAVIVMVNSAPVLAPDVASTQFGVPVTLQILPNDADPDGDALTVIATIVDPAQGTVAINPDGTLTFTPASTFSGPAVITYVVQDSNGATSFTTASVERANAGPAAEARVVYTYCGTTLLVNPLRLVTDVDDDTLSVVAVSQPARGTVTIMPDGYIRYKPGRLFRGNVTDSFTVTVADGNGGTTQAEIRVRAFDAIAGTFQGLLEELPLLPGGIAPAALAAPASPYRGRITATMNGRASYSARLELDGRVIRFTGILSGALQSQRKIRVAGSPALVTLTYHDLTDSWSVDVQGAGLALRSTSNVLRAVKSGRSRAAAFDVALAAEPGSPWEEIPGAATLTLRPAGVAAIAGRLPDGSRFTAGARLNSAGSLSLYRWLGNVSAKDAPLLGGVLESFAPANGSFSGALFWKQSEDVQTLQATGALK